MNEEKETMDKTCCGPGNWRKRWLFIPLFIIAIALILGAIVMFLWNAVMPEIFTSIRPITYCEAIGLLILSRILFGGFRKGGGGGWKRGNVRQWKEKWMNMSEEERAKFKEEWKNRGGDCKC